MNLPDPGGISSNPTFGKREDFGTFFRCFGDDCTRLLYGRLEV